jgi:tungstate transport system substrate-binding protein
MTKNSFRTAILCATIVSGIALSAWAAAPLGGDAAGAGASRDLILATTTSLQDSGLLDILLPRFEALFPYRVKAIAVGSGEALRMGEQGSADVLVVHSPADEEKFMAAGFGKERKELMSNDFVIVGPTGDPAKVRGLSVADSLRSISGRGSVFVSRADASGTDKKEKGLWKKTGLTPAGAWYLESGQGMAETLRIASEKAGYTLTDRGTFLAVRARLDLVVLVEGEADLLNVYHVITVNPERHADIDILGAEAFMEFLLSSATQKAIGEFGLDKFGVPLFKPVLKAPVTGARE